MSSSSLFSPCNLIAMRHAVFAARGLHGLNYTTLNAQNKRRCSSAPAPQLHERCLSRFIVKVSLCTHRILTEELQTILVFILHLCGIPADADLVRAAPVESGGPPALGLGGACLGYPLDRTLGPRGVHARLGVFSKDCAIAQGTTKSQGVLKRSHERKYLLRK